MAAMQYHANKRAHRDAIANARWDEVVELFVEPGEVGDDPSDQRLDDAQTIEVTRRRRA